MNKHSIHSGGNLLARRKQVNTLHIFNENVIEVRQNLEYRIAFQAGDEVPLNLQILLPPDFPSRSRPLLRIFPTKCDESIGRLSHPWLGADNMVVGSPGLNNFGIHSDLGRVVQAIKREFEKNPPTVIKENNGNQINCKHEPSPKTPLVVRSGGGQPLIPEITKLSEEELKELQTDKLAFKVFCSQFNVTMLSSMDENYAKLKEEIMSIIETSAEFSKELCEKKESFQLKLTELENTRKISAEMKRDLMETAQQLAKPNLCDKLLAASHADECESEACAEQFLSGNLPIDDFLTNYIQKRTLHHLRKTKHDRIVTSHNHQK
jgi:ESCRT-I complex subunit VPS37